MAVSHELRSPVTALAAAVDVIVTRRDDFTERNRQAIDIVASQVGNVHYPQYPNFEDFGDILVRGNGGTGYIRVDWFTPAGLSNWGDGRTFILGTKGFIELRKYAELARGRAVDHVYLVDESGEHYIPVAGKVGYRYFGQLILDSLTPREAKVLRMRFGIEMNTDHTLEEVGKQFDVTRERIRQIEAKALRKLRHPSRSRKLRAFLEGPSREYL